MLPNVETTTDLVSNSGIACIGGLQPRNVFRVGFFYADAFSFTGGIQKFNRSFIKALNDLENEGELVAEIISVCDGMEEPAYNYRSSFRGFNKRRLSSVINLASRCRSLDVVIIGHIHYAIVGLMVKLINPSCRLIFVAHGKEIWQPLSIFQKTALKRASRVFAVSNFTKNKVLFNNNLKTSAIRVFPNTVDPYFHVPSGFSKPEKLWTLFNIKPGTKVILTLSRLLYSEKYKGYDNVIRSLPLLKKKVPNVVYILAGKCDPDEKARIDTLAGELDVTQQVIFTGFVNDKEVPDLFQFADVFIMPSRKEGFGIVFLEAMCCGTPVIGGNEDGTVDALENGRLGTLVNPRNIPEIAEALSDALSKPTGEAEAKNLQKRVLEKFAFPVYKQRLREVLRA